MLSAEAQSAESQCTTVAVWETGNPFLGYPCKQGRLNIHALKQYITTGESLATQPQNAVVLGDIS